MAHQLTMTERAINIQRAKEDLQLLTAHAAATANQLGRARERLNKTYTGNGAAAELALVELEAMVTEIYGGSRPPNRLNRHT